MPKTIDPVKIGLVKKAKLKGLTDKAALLEAGYAETTAGHNISPYNKLLKTVREQIEREFKLSNVTVEQVLKEIDTVRELAIKCDDLSTAGRMSELKGRYLAMFTDKMKVDNTIITKADQGIIDQYMPNTSNSSRLPHTLTN